MNTPLPPKLDEVKAKRGYLLPHHGLMAISMPRVLDAYDALYSELTLTERVLSKHEHETVWIAILIACEEALGTHHVRRYFDAGGSNEELERISALAAYVAGARVHTFMDEHWLPHLPDYSPRHAYLEGLARCADPIAEETTQLAAAAVCTCRGEWTRLAWHIEALYAAGGREHAMAEALSLTMFPGGVPNFVDAAKVWHAVLRKGEVTPSAEFAAWAALAGQGGYDEAARVTG